jgi:prepilin-type N-terminal cleavage/methylation domain-containing protein
MRDDGDGGFTLIELLVVVSIIGIIGTVLAGVVMMGFNTYSYSTVRLNESNDRQLVADYFSRDAQSATTLALSGGTCGTSSGTTVMRLTWNESDASATPVVTAREVTYRLLAGTAPASGTLTRVLCANGAVTSTIVVSAWVSPGASSVVATCLTAALANDSTCAATDRGARITVTESGGAFVVDGVRRTE